MDTLFWTKINPEVKLTASNRQFFNKYLYKISVHIDGCTIWMMRNKRYLDYDSLADFQEKVIAHVTGYFTSSNDGGCVLDNQTGIISYNNSVFRSNRFSPEFIDSHRLWTILQYKQEYAPTKVIHTLTVHSNKIVIYSNQMPVLRELATDLDFNPNKCLVGSNGYLVEVAAPAEKDVNNILNGFRLSTKADRFPYRCNLKGIRNYTIDEQLAILNYIETLEKNEYAEIPRFVKHHLRLFLGQWPPSLYFYCADSKFDLFLDIIKPGCVSSMQPLVLPA